MEERREAVELAAPKLFIAAAGRRCRALDGGDGGRGGAMAVGLGLAAAVAPPVALRDDAFYSP
jgi:hypothetical protein